MPSYSDWSSFVKLMQTANIDHVSVHCRTREEMSRGFAHWSAVKQLIEDDDITIPINISGD